jgi:hypothetical protein
MKYYLADEIRSVRWLRHVVHIAEGEVHTRLWWEKLRERPCERPRWYFNFKIDLKEI